MNNSLRTYQSDLYLAARRALAGNRSVCIQLATGAGKTPVMAAMCESVFDKDKLAWILVNRKELITQTSAHLSKWNVPHNTINPRSNESKSFNIHVVSSDTLIRRFDKIKRWPNLLLIDECHLMIDRQIDISKHLPTTSKIIGVTATPERGDSRGLSTQAGGIYDELIEGPSIPWLTEHDFMAPLRYFSPPLDGLSDLHIRKGEYDEEELDALLKRKKIYGELVGHYSNHGKGKPALIFCRSIKAADQTAERFRDKGFKFFNIDSTMTDTRRRELIAALTNGMIDGLCGVDIFSYGIDIPRVEYGATIRPTLSRAVYMQGVGRILRPWSDPVTGYKKEEALFFDHVNNLLEHQDAAYPGIPLHYAPHITWNFNGTEKRKRAKNNNVVLCPHLDFLYCPRPHCAICEHNPDKTIKDVRKPMVVVPAELIEAPHPIPLMDMPPEERREIQDRIGDLAREYKQKPAPGPIEQLLKISDDLGYNSLWVYHRLTYDSRHTINVPLLHEICRIKGWKPGKVYFMMRELRARRSA